MRRIARVRDLLESFTLHRSFVQVRAGAQTTIEVSAPLIERRAVEMSATVRDIEGISSRHSWSAWSIEEKLWKATVDATHGGSPAFMLIDERAFRLESSDSFNLYWTLINRAYFHWRDARGARGKGASSARDFTERLGVLYDWAGRERAGTRVKRERAALVAALDEMIRHGLIESWSCGALDLDKKHVERGTLLSSKLSVRLPEDITRIATQNHGADRPVVLVDAEGHHAPLATSR